MTERYSDDELREVELKHPHVKTCQMARDLLKFRELTRPQDPAGGRFLFAQFPDALFVPLSAFADLHADTPEPSEYRPEFVAATRKALAEVDAGDFIPDAKVRQEDTESGNTVGAPRPYYVKPAQPEPPPSVESMMRKHGLKMPTEETMRERLDRETGKRVAEEPEPPPLHTATDDLVTRFTAALREKLGNAERKYGYSDGWQRADWLDECREKLREHVEKGDPRDVAAYCAFLWHHGESTSTAKQPEPPPARPFAEGDLVTPLRGRRKGEVGRITDIDMQCAPPEARVDYGAADGWGWIPLSDLADAPAAREPEEREALPSPHFDTSLQCEPEWRAIDAGNTFAEAICARLDQIVSLLKGRQT